MVKQLSTPFSPFVSLAFLNHNPEHTWLLEPQEPQKKPGDVNMATGGGAFKEVGKKPGDTHICQAYESFKAALQDVRSSYRHLNPQLGQLLH